MAEFPHTYAFLVQFSDQTTPGSRMPDGRIEQIDSGLRGRFSSPEELLAFMEQVLAQHSVCEHNAPANPSEDAPPDLF